MTDRAESITATLNAISTGEGVATDSLFLLVYDELRAMAANRLQSERADHTFQPTALVHEAYLRLARDHRPGWPSHRYFFAAAAEAMHRI